MSRDSLENGLIILTDEGCKIAEQPWPNIPTLLWPEGIDVDASDWLRNLVVAQGVGVSSAREYAKIIRPFLRFCRARQRKWQAVDDGFLIIWREHLHRALKLSTGRINTSLQTIFAFYRWAEETGRTRFQVGIYTLDQLPASMRHMPFPISAKQTFSKGRQGRVYGNWRTTLLLAGKAEGASSRHTPTENEIQNLHEILAERTHGERDSLMLSWAEDTGARRAEFLSVKKYHLPDPETLAKLIDEDQSWVVEIQRKGGSKKPLTVPTDLLIRTLDYINFGRSEIVAHCYKNIVGYKEPDDIFLSASTGMVLHPDSVTATGRKIFRQAGIRKANVHRLRARFAIRTIETLVDALFEDEIVGSTSTWVETILVKAAEIMGHADYRSLRPYLNYVLNRRIQTADATKAEKLSTRLRNLRLSEATLVRRLAQHKELQAAATHLKQGRDETAAALLRRIADELESTDRRHR